MAGEFGEKAIPFSYDGFLQNPLRPLPRAANTILQFTLRSNLSTGPHDRIPQDGTRLDNCVFTNDRAAEYLCSWMHASISRHCQRPFWRPKVVRFPCFCGKCAMKV